MLVLLTSCVLYSVWFQSMVKRIRSDSNLLLFGLILYMRVILKKVNYV